MRLSSGLEMLDDHAGAGRAAERGDRVVYNVRIFLNRGDEVRLNETQAQALPQHMLRQDDGRVFVDHTIVLGSREAVAGIERALTGMKRGGYRKVRVGPHLAYREKGIPGLIPPNAVLVVEIWMREVVAKGD
jgi:FKBP-type peptidyl-prolyl cis-trans isomerase